jgi:riboflavin kinase / FMN adenylyltransferase
LHFKTNNLKIFQSLQDFNPKSKTIITIGTFDGVHLGHKKIIQKIIQNSLQKNCESVLLTFFPHPRMVLQDDSEIKLLNTIDEKIILLEKTGLQNLVIQNFDIVFSQLTAEEFVKTILVDQMNIQKIIIGYDHRFGKNRTANIDDLILFGKKYNFEVEQISAQEINEVSISSTKIRNAIIDGNIELANQYLDSEYLLTGNVIKGKQLGRTIGFPTANIYIEENFKLVPKIGVYIVKSIINLQTVFGIMNIGYNPTVDGKNFSIEVYFLNFGQDLYGKQISVSVIKRIRDEQKFESIDLLKQQLEKDKQFAISFIKNQNI